MQQAAAWLLLLSRCCLWIQTENRNVLCPMPGQCDVFLFLGPKTTWGHSLADGGLHGCRFFFGSPFLFGFLHIPTRHFQCDVFLFLGNSPV